MPSSTHAILPTSCPPLPHISHLFPLLHHTMHRLRRVLPRCVVANRAYFSPDTGNPYSVSVLIRSFDQRWFTDMQFVAVWHKHTHARAHRLQKPRPSRLNDAARSAGPADQTQGRAHSSDHRARTQAPYRIEYGRRSGRIGAQNVAQPNAFIVHLIGAQRRTIAPIPKRHVQIIESNTSVT